MINTGGRVQFVIGEKVRIIEIDGSTSTAIYEIDQERSDRKGLLKLKMLGTEIVKKIHHRRITSIDSINNALVLENNSRYYALCPTCGDQSEVTPEEESLTCLTCGKYNFKWVNTKPDSLIYKKKKTTTKMGIAMQKRTKADIKALAKLENCELWVKIVPFDHERIDVRAYILLYTSDNPRKLCFNTYDGYLGKKSKPIDTQSFLNNTYEGKPPWFSIKEKIETAKQKMITQGYERYTEE